MLLDGNPRMNLASFVTTYMERECEELMQDAARKNWIGACPLGSFFSPDNNKRNHRNGGVDSQLTCPFL